MRAQRDLLKSAVLHASCCENPPASHPPWVILSPSKTIASSALAVISWNWSGPNREDRRWGRRRGVELTACQNEGRVKASLQIVVNTSYRSGGNPSEHTRTYRDWSCHDRYSTNIISTRCTPRHDLLCLQMSSVITSWANVGEKLEAMSKLVRVRVLGSDGYTFKQGFKEDRNKI